MGGFDDNCDYCGKYSLIRDSYVCSCCNIKQCEQCFAVAPCAKCYEFCCLDCLIYIDNKYTCATCKDV